MLTKNFPSIYKAMKAIFDNGSVKSDYCVNYIRGGHNTVPCCTRSLIKTVCYFRGQSTPLQSVCAWNKNRFCAQYNSRLWLQIGGGVAC